jgi:membrane peptidoglycan carboxypeptidase
MGHGLSVNTLQLAAAFNVVPSGGTLYRPYIIKQIATPDGEVIESGEPEAVRSLLSPETCELLKDFLASVVDSGTAKYSKSSIVTFSGKTGTAQKPIPTGGGYYQDRFVSTFAGYFPRRDPVAVGVVVLDDAQPLHYAGMTAAKIFASIAERIASLKNLPAPNRAIAQDTAAALELIEVPDLVGCHADSTHVLLADVDLDIRAVNAGASVVRQYPQAGSRLAPGERLILYLAGTDDADEDDLRDIVGLSVRQAVTSLLNRGYEVDLKGSGLVKSVKKMGVADGARKRCRIICSKD